MPNLIPSALENTRRRHCGFRSHVVTPKRLLTIVVSERTNTFRFIPDNKQDQRKASLTINVDRQNIGHGVCRTTDIASFRSFFPLSTDMRRKVRGHESCGANGVVFGEVQSMAALRFRTLPISESFRFNGYVAFSKSLIEFQCRQYQLCINAVSQAAEAKRRMFDQLSQLQTAKQKTTHVIHRQGFVAVSFSASFEDKRLRIHEPLDGKAFLAGTKHME